jgi:hypothetical protein
MFIISTNSMITLLFILLITVSFTIMLIRISDEFWIDRYSYGKYFYFLTVCKYILFSIFVDFILLFLVENVPICNNSVYFFSHEQGWSHQFVSSCWLKYDVNIINSHIQKITSSPHPFPGDAALILREHHNGNLRLTDLKRSIAKSIVTRFLNKCLRCTNH